MSCLFFSTFLWLKGEKSTLFTKYLIKPLGNMSSLSIFTRVLVKIIMTIFIVVHQANPSSASETHQSEVSCDPVLSQRCEQVCQDSVCVDSYGNEAQNSPVCQCDEILEEESDYNCLDAEISTPCASKCEEISDSDESYQAKICTSEGSTLSNMSPICVCHNPSLEYEQTIEELEENRREKRAGSSKAEAPSASSGPDERVPIAIELRDAAIELIAICEGVKNGQSFTQTDKEANELLDIVNKDIEKLKKLNGTSKKD